MVVGPDIKSGTCTNSGYYALFPAPTRGLGAQLVSSVSALLHHRKVDTARHEVINPAMYYINYVFCKFLVGLYFILIIVDDRASESPKPRQLLLLKHSISHTNVTGHKSARVTFEDPGSPIPETSLHNIKRQATRMYVERQKSKLLPTIGYEPILDDSSEEGLDIHVDALNNVTHEPTDQQIKKQIQRWKTEISLGTGEKKSTASDHRTKALKPKHAKSFYDLRKAMANRENVTLEHSSTVIKKALSPTPGDALKPINPLAKTQLLTSKATDKSKTLLALVNDIPIVQENKSKAEAKIYTNESNFEYKISKDSPPGFEISIDTTEAEKSCRNVVKNIKPKESELNLRNEIEELFKLWKSSGFLKNIEQYALSASLGTDSSASTVTRCIASSSANYLAILSDDVHRQVAKAYAIYCWIANNTACNITSILATEEEQCGFFPESNEIENKSASFDHCTLFVKMALHANLEAEIINGQVRTWKKVNGDLDFSFPHSWTVVSGSITPQCINRQLTHFVPNFHQSAGKDWRFTTST